MKTKKIDVWISEFAATAEIPIDSELVFKPNKDEKRGYIVKAKLVIPVPDKEVTITETQLKEAIYQYDKNNSPTAFAHLKRLLGFSNGESHTSESE